MKSRKIFTFLLAGMLFILTGCVTGREISADKRIPLVKDSSQSGEWKAFEYTMQYSYTFTQPEDGTPGSIELSGFLQKTGGGLDGLTIWLYLLDGNGMILERKIAYNADFKSERYMEREFTVTLDTPPETVGISFAHVAMESRGRGSP